MIASLQLLGGVVYTSGMGLSAYHQQYMDLPDSEIARRVEEKKRELDVILLQVPLRTAAEPVKIAVMGCADKRLIPAHKQVFGDILHKTVVVTTFDITIAHLEGGEGVIEHDCTEPLPGGLYSVTYAHKFIEREKQWDAVKSSYDCLESGGLSIHVLDREEVDSEEEVLPGGLFSVPLDEIKRRLNQEGIAFREIQLQYGIGLVLMK
jgi:hypothetical protein